MNTLTQEQVDDLVFKLQGRPAKYADKLLANAAFALGVAQGIQQERDRINYRAAVFANAPHNVTV